MSNTKPSLSIIVPAFMEAKNIRGTIENILSAANGIGLIDYEILIIDCLKKDGTHDGTPEIAEELAHSNPKIRAVHNPYMTLGAKYWQGAGLSKYEYITWIPGDNETEPETIKAVFEAVGQADIICFYTANPEARPWKLRILSRLYTFMVNALFGLHLRYFNGITIYKTALLKSLPKSARENTEFSYNAEILVRLIKLGRHCYKELPQYIDARASKNFNLFDFKRFSSRYTPLKTLKKLAKLFWEVRLKRPSVDSPF